jgi:hypothetical protein
MRVASGDGQVSPRGLGDDDPVKGIFVIPRGDRLDAPAAARAGKRVRWAGQPRRVRGSARRVFDPGHSEARGLAGEACLLRGYPPTTDLRSTIPRPPRRRRRSSRRAARRRVSPCSRAMARHRASIKRAAKSRHKSGSAPASSALTSSTSSRAWRAKPTTASCASAMAAGVGAGSSRVFLLCAVSVLDQHAPAVRKRDAPQLSAGDLAIWRRRHADDVVVALAEATLESCV